MTDAAEFDAPSEDTTTDAQQPSFDLRPFVDSWREELSGETSVSAGSVQDRLLELWGHLDEGEERSAVERWLTETLGRHLYQAEDVRARLDGLVASESAAAAG